MKSLRNLYKVHESGQIFELICFCPWMEHYFELEKELAITPEVKYVVFADKNGCRVRGVPVAKESFVGRKFMPESWRSLRDEELSLVTGIEGCMFVHSTGFIGGHKTGEGALRMAIKSLES